MKHSKGQKVLIVLEIVFAREASDALVAQALYIFEQTKSVEISDRYLDNMKEFIISTLSHFPKAGRSAEEFGKGVRKLVYQGYSILYKIDNDKIVILTLFRENLPDV